MASFFNILLDTLAPSGLTVLINDGAKYTTGSTVSLKIAVDDADTSGYQMKIWGTADVETEEAASWQTFAATKSVGLSTGDGLKTIYVKVRDDVGNESSIASDSITLNTSVPTVIIDGPDKSKISKVEGYNTSTFSFISDMIFTEYKVCVVPVNTSLNTVGVIIPDTNGSENTSGTGEFPADTPIDVTIKGADLEAASSGDGTKIIKVFVKNEAGTWSVA